MILFISLFTIFANLYLGFLVFIKNPKSVTHRFFLLFTAFVAIWSVTNYFSLLGAAPEEALFRIRIVLSVAVLMFSFLYFFSINFPFPNWRIPVLHFGIITTFSLSVIILVFTPLVFKEVSVQNGIVTPVPNFGLLFYSLSIIGLPLAASVVLIRKFLAAQGKEREQLRFLSLGIILTFILTTITNFLLVSVFKFTNLVILGPFFTLIFAGFSTYAILRHQLMDIRVILTEALVFLIAFILLMDIFVSQNIYQIFLRTGTFLLFGFFGFLLIKSVLNEIKRREQLEKLTLELKRTSEKLKKVDKAKSEFLSIASHQLRTPLTAIQGYTSMVLEESYGKVPSKMLKPLKNVFTSSKRLINLINTLLNISRIEAERIKLDIQRTNIEETISSVVQELAIEAQDRKIALKWQKPSLPLPEISVDSAKIRQIILNIVDNAIRYTNQGWVAVEAKKLGNKIKISVSDTGEGMTKEEMGQIFQIFSRGKSGSKFWAEGTGLGLYVARKFAEMHGGKIWAESEGKGKGSTFYVELPCKES